MALKGGWLVRRWAWVGISFVAGAVQNFLDRLVPCEELVHLLVEPEAFAYKIVDFRHRGSVHEDVDDPDDADDADDDQGDAGNLFGG